MPITWDQVRKLDETYSYRKNLCSKKERLLKIKNDIFIICIPRESGPLQDVVVKRQQLIDNIDEQLLVLDAEIAERGGVP